MVAGSGGVKFVLLVNKQGQTRLAKYTDASMSVEERRALEGEIVRKCLARSEKQVSCTSAARAPCCSSIACDDQLTPREPASWALHAR